MMLAMFSVKTAYGSASIVGKSLYAVVCYGSSAYGNVMIADQMNFSSLSYFSRYCTKHLGLSPSEYRRSLQPRG